MQVRPETCKQLAIKARHEDRPNEAFAIIVEMTTAPKAHRVTALGREMEGTGLGFVCHIFNRNRCGTLLLTSKPLDGRKGITLRLV